jgi:hypothetical protein
LYIQFRPKAEEAGDEPVLEARCGDFELTDYISAWESLPPLKPPIAIDADVHAGGADAAATGGGDNGAGVDGADVEVEDIGPGPPHA